MNEVLRQEKKYLMNQVDCLKLQHQLENVMMADIHNGSQGYLVRSLYFDSPYEEDYEDKLDGIELRKKIRLRIYHPNDQFASLEMKQKQGNRQMKRSIRLNKQDALKLIAGQYEVLLKYPEPFASECYGIMMMRVYRPKTIVEYHRKAFIAKENKIRITLDSHIYASESSFDLFNPHLNMVPVLDSFNAVLEVKFNGFLLSYIKDLVENANRSELSVSKYCLARSSTLKFGF